MSFRRLTCLLAFLPLSSQAQPWIVKDGSAQAEIVIATEAPRTTRLAAEDLRRHIEKISGARLSVTHEPNEGFPVKLYVGQSPHTEKLGISTDGLSYGAYRLVSGKDWMVYIGDDTNFSPREPWARNNGDRSSGKLQREWEERTGLPYGVPNGGMYKNRTLMPAGAGLPDGADSPTEREYLWDYDERGSFNAVAGYLRSLGVRWYMPGDVGEVLPQMKSIPLPKIDQTVHPDFRVRQFNVRFGTVNDDIMLWCMRLGMRQPYGLMVAHGMHTMTEPDALKEKHPDWFAMFGGKRDTQVGKRLNHLCYSNPELFEETVRWARAQFDVYDYQTVSIMPPDAYIAICQCELCEGEEIPEMGARGKLSNHVWDFVNRVAKEVGKTHPTKKILCCAYGANTDPPTNIEKLEPNVQVCIVGGRRPRNSLPEQRDPIRKLREGWIEKTDNKIMIFENYPFTGRGQYLPGFVSKVMGDSINATKGHSDGEDIWLTFTRDFDTKDVGFNHFQVYFTARMYWGGKQRDPVAMLEEYCRLFYGPASDEMLAFFQYCEPNYQAMHNDIEKVRTALALFDAAKTKISAQPDSMFARRMKFIDDYLEPLRNKREQLAQKRGPVPKLRTVWEPKQPIVIDGKLDDQYWVDCPTASMGSLRELQTGRRPTFGTTVRSGWDKSGQNLYFAIRCQDLPGEPLNIATDKREDQAIWYGDAIEILLDTDSHSYYQIAVNPAGALVDLDRGADKSAWFRWESQAEVATHIADDHWTVEVRIPVTDDENDPLNQVIGRKPSQSLPWHINVCRQRIRENGAEHSALSPTGTGGFHEPMKFAHFYDGRSHTFEADASVTDYLVESRRAEQLSKARKYEEGIAAWLALSDSEGLTDFQRSTALANAAATARAQKDDARAAEVTGRIPIEAIANTARLENALARRDVTGVLGDLGDEDLDNWPFWQIGPAALARGRAFHLVKDGAKAETDYQLATRYISDPRTRLSLLRNMASNREDNLKDPDSALTIYSEIAKSGGNQGSSDYLLSVQSAARILTDRGDPGRALEVLNLVDAEKLSGSWKPSVLLCRGRVLEALGKKEEAVAVYKAVLADQDANAAHRKGAEEGLEKLGVNNE